MKRTRIFTSLRLLPAIVCPETNWNFWSFKRGVILPFYTNCNLCAHSAGKTCAISVKASEHPICLFLCLSFSHLSFSPFFSLFSWSSFCCPSFYSSIFSHFPLPSLFFVKVSVLCYGGSRCSHRKFYVQIRNIQHGRIHHGRISQLPVFSQGWGAAHCNAVLRSQRLPEISVSIPNGHPGYNQGPQDIGVGFR